MSWRDSPRQGVPKIHIIPIISKWSITYNNASVDTIKRCVILDNGWNRVLPRCCAPRKLSKTALVLLLDTKPQQIIVYLRLKLLIAFLMPISPTELRSQHAPPNCHASLYAQRRHLADEEEVDQSSSVHQQHAHEQCKVCTGPDLLYACTPTLKQTKTPQYYYEQRSKLVLIRWYASPCFTLSYPQPPQFFIAI